MISRPVQTRVSTIAVGMLALGGLCGCEAQTEAGHDAGKARPGSTIIRPQPARTPERVWRPERRGAHVRVHGVVLGRSGDQLTTQRPFEQGTVVAIPIERFRTFRSGATGPWKGGISHGSDFPLPPDLLSEPEVASSDLHPDGTYSLSLPPGEYAFCLGNLSGTNAGPGAADGIRVEKWFEVTVTSEAFQTVVPIFDRTTGEITVHR